LASWKPRKKRLLQIGRISFERERGQVFLLRILLDSIWEEIRALPQ
jgi:hypothetical protein